MVLHVRLLRRAASGEYDLAPDQLFSSIEQCSSPACSQWRKKKASLFAWPLSRPTICGKQSYAQRSISIPARSCSEVRRRSRNDQAREIGLSWERMPEPRPRVTLEIFTPSGPGTGLLSWTACAEAHAERNRPAAQNLASIERSDCRIRKSITTISSISRWTKLDARWAMEWKRIFSNGWTTT